MTGPERDEFDRMIEQEIAGAVPSQGVVEEVNPWHEPIDRIAGGLALTGITLNFLYLQYLLPAVGVVLQYLGFRALRRNGTAFRLAWVLSIVRLTWVGAFLVLSVTPWLPIGDLDFALGLTSMILQIVQLLALRAGLRQTCRTAGVEPQSDPLRAAACWEALILVLAFSPLANSWLAGIPMVIAFVCIVRALFRLGESMGEAGYCFVAAPVRVNTRVVRWGYLGGCLLLMLVLSVCVNHPRLDAAPMEEHGETEIRQQLSDLGLPDEVLADLTDEDVRALKSATFVSSVESDFVFNRIAQGTGFENAELIVKTFCIDLSNQQMAMLVHFAWQEGAAHWNDAISLSCSAEAPYELKNGLLLYEKDGAAFQADISNLGVVQQTVNSYFGPNTYSQISGNVSYPFGTERQRGYVLYTMQMEYAAWSGNADFEYLHTVHPIRLPYRTAEEMLRQAGWRSSNAYQQQIIYFTNETVKDEHDSASYTHAL